MESGKTRRGRPATGRSLESLESAKLSRDVWCGLRSRVWLLKRIHNTWKFLKGMGLFNTDSDFAAHLLSLEMVRFHECIPAFPISAQKPLFLGTAWGHILALANCIALICPPSRWSGKIRLGRKITVRSALNICETYTTRHISAVRIRIVNIVKISNIIRRLNEKSKSLRFCGLTLTVTAMIASEIYNLQITKKEKVKILPGSGTS